MLGFDRFTDGAQEIVTRAYEVMMRHEHTQLDTEHIVRGAAGADRRHRARRAGGAECRHGGARGSVWRTCSTPARAQPRPGGMRPQQVYITPRVKRLMDRSSEEATRLGDEFISTEHLLLAVLTDGDSAAARILSDAGSRTRSFGEALSRTRKGEPAAQNRQSDLEDPGKVQPRPDAGCPRGQARSGDRARRGDHARAAGALAAHQEQPGADRRGRRGQDGHRRGPGAKDRRRAMCPRRC